MCDHHCKPLQPLRERTFSLLKLDCWQREYDKRPYQNFCFNQNDFEERMKRKFDVEKDFPIIIEFLRERKQLRSMKLSGLKLLTADDCLLSALVQALSCLPKIEISLCELPSEFFNLLQQNVQEMQVEDLILQGKK